MRAPHRGVHNTTLDRPSARHRREQGWIRSDRRWQCERARGDGPTSAWNVAHFLLLWHRPATRGECPTRKNTNPVTARPQRPTTKN
jgi:hypothetical protein